jgi:hypothetical protein
MYLKGYTRLSDWYKVCRNKSSCLHAVPPPPRPASSSSQYSTTAAAISSAPNLFPDPASPPRPCPASQSAKTLSKLQCFRDNFLSKTNKTVSARPHAGAPAPATMEMNSSISSLEEMHELIKDKYKVGALSKDTECCHCLTLSRGWGAGRGEYIGVSI